MTRDEALNTITIMATAWPYPEWEKGRVELWVAALIDRDAEAVNDAIVQAVRELDRCPSVAWVLEAARGRESREQFGLPESSATPASKETALAGLAAARAALATRSPEGGE